MIFCTFDHWSEILSLSAGRPTSQGACPARFTQLSYTAASWATLHLEFASLHPFELHCTLLSSAAPFELHCTLNDLHRRIALYNLLIVGIPDCPATGESLPEWTKMTIQVLEIYAPRSEPKFSSASLIWRITLAVASMPMPSCDIIIFKVFQLHRWGLMLFYKVILKLCFHLTQDF